MIEVWIQLLDFIDLFVALVQN